MHSSFTFSHAVVCHSLPPLSNGTISYSDSTPDEGSVAAHTCEPEFTIVGGSSRVCQSDGTWTGVSITCELGGNIYVQQNYCYSYYCLARICQHFRKLAMKRFYFRTWKFCCNSAQHFFMLKFRGGVHIL